MIANPEASVAFFRQLNVRYARRDRVYVSLQNVTQVDYDAIVVLLAVMVRFKASNIEFNGDLPQDPVAAETLRESGFFQTLYRSIPDRDVYQFGHEHGIYTHAYKNVDSALSARIIEHASKTVWKTTRRSQWTQRILIELMQNTNNHASLHRRGDKHWWLSVHHRTKEHKVRFSFVDLGVGIFNSLDQKAPNSLWFGWRSKLMAIFRMANNAEILELILKGDFHRTVTGKEYRGKGLPGIAEAASRNGVSNLFVVTNDVYADVSSGVFRTMAAPFDGTLVYWELDEQNISSPGL